MVRKSQSARRSITWHSLVLIAALAPVAAGCGDDDSGDTADTSTGTDAATSPPEEIEGDSGTTDGATTGGDALAELTAAAEAEGRLVIYGVPAENILRDLCDGFSDEYDIDCEFSRIVGNELYSRLDAELEAGAGTADVVLVVRGTTPVRKYFTDGSFVSPDDVFRGFPDLLPGKVPEAFVFEDLDAYGVYARPFTINYNTDEVAEEDVPKTWEDLADPRWRGRIATQSPLDSEAYWMFWGPLYDAYGEDFLERLAENDMTPLPSASTATQAVAAGEYAAFVPGNPDMVLEAAGAGAPLDYVIPEQTTLVATLLGITRNAPHPNAATLFAQYALSEKGANVLTDAFGFTPFGSRPVPPQYEDPAVASVWGQASTDVSEETRRKIAEIMGF